LIYDSADILAAQDHFGFARPVPIEKDWHILRAMRAVASVDATPFHLVFAGGTCLARAHKLIRRMSEDVDFKIVPLNFDPVSRSKRRKELADLRDRVTAGLRAVGFPIDTTDATQLRSRDDNRYTVYQLPYIERIGTGEPLRPTIQIELNYTALRLPSVALPVASFVAEAFNRPSEIPTIDCVSVAETAAEKLVALTRRTAMELADLSRAPDPALIRHVYDLHATRERYDTNQVAELARTIMLSDAKEFANQFPAYRENPMHETHRALAALKTEERYAQHYAEFLDLMVYGDKPRYTDALLTVEAIAGLL
jgi:predicted nucleotidyltransferase component of viral defense system